MLIRKVFGTAGARVFTALMAMLVMIVSTRAFGDDGYGVITMIMLSIMFIGMFNDLIGGAALVYIIPRYKLSEVLTLAYLWSLFTATAGAVILYFYDGDVAGPYVHHVFFIALIYNLFSVNLKSLLGLERIAVFNVFNVLQVLFLTGSPGTHQ
ncbi:MAG: hypothetical protein R6U19_07400 [Bacteroidales bacterium]